MNWIDIMLWITSRNNVDNLVKLWITLWMQAVISEAIPEKVRGRSGACHQASGLTRLFHPQ
ncbi:MAG: hypothetical protein HY675_09345 [Chloroflexi bacterium]|nr:hypothetical protein [Chloroflexota bacterium]